MIPDTVFIVAGVLPLLAAVAWGYLHLRDLREPARVHPVREQELEVVPAYGD